MKQNLGVKFLQPYFNNQFFYYFIILLPILMANCKWKKAEENKDLSKSVIIGSDTIALLANPEKLNGKQLSLIYCQKCHSYPDPSLLPKNLWKEGVLPEMAFRMG